SLESVFLKLCCQASRSGSEQQLEPADNCVVKLNTDANGNDVDLASISIEMTSAVEIESSNRTPELIRDSASSLESFRSLPKPRRIGAVVLKDFTNMIRRIGFLLFQFSLPVLQIVLFCLCVGPEPRDLRLAIVNDDVSGNYSREFIESLDGNKLGKVIFPDLQQARAEVLSANAWSVLHFRKNFSSSLTQRLINPVGLSNETLRQGSLHLEMDDTNYQVSAVLQKTIAKNLQNFLGDLLEKQGQPRVLASLPVEYRPPLLGSKDPTFTEFMAPGMIITILFFLSTGLTAVTFVSERRHGLLDRSLVAGVTISELMLGHILTQLVVMSGRDDA
uniref:ABC transporter G family member 20 n=1 Tax=Macrostomum lignano TaxID=282301 RepID=A0A1I8GJ08_9PLAT